MNSRHRDAGEAYAGPRARIDLDAIRTNVGIARERSEGRECIAVVKADGYGHGVLPVAREVLAAGATQLAVVTPDEAAELRSGGIAAPLLVLGGPRDADEAVAIVEAHATAVLHHEVAIRWLSDAARKVGRSANAQIEVDTGMRRMGVTEEQAPAFAERIASEAGLSLQGVFTHFARADEDSDSASIEQCERFRAVLRSLDQRGISPVHVHAANSAGLLSPSIVAALPEATAVRPGLMLYGVCPAARHAELGLKPAMSLRAPVVQIHAVSRGEAVGYGGTWRAERDTRVATLALGYADGLSWMAANPESGAEVWLGGARCPIAGRVSMDSVGVEIGPEGGAVAVRLGDEAVLFGPLDADEQTESSGVVPISVEQAATAARTLHYELLVRVGRRVERDFTGASSGV
ncbi:MAG: alanine racemase [Myxococcota bacterium]|nr:alanine racemase [Myxococcota bacterium]